MRGGHEGADVWDADAQVAHIDIVVALEFGVEPNQELRWAREWDGVITYRVKIHRMHAWKQ